MMKPGLLLAAALFCLSAVPAHAAPAHATPLAKSPVEVVVLGSGGPRAFGRAGSSYIILLDGTPRILVDAGPGAFVRIGDF